MQDATRSQDDVVGREFEELGSAVPRCNVTLALPLPKHETLVRYRMDVHVVRSPGRSHRIVEAGSPCANARPQNELSRQSEAGEGSTKEDVEDCTLLPYLVEWQVLGTHFGFTLLGSHLAAWHIDTTRVEGGFEDRRQIQSALSSIVESRLLVEVELGRRDLGHHDEILGRPGWTPDSVGATFREVA